MSFCRLAISINRNLIDDAARDENRRALDGRKSIDMCRQIHPIQELYLSDG